ncbi:hypothetical protein EIN_273740 [Entamoeba invadens IP1]|uniref:Uncharacterized protein n=1 Tax=Entamoeba invadens IP1 TaxID=370355 RepID=A0A0A1U1F0_ENTIV|nr:hypothetical protein EIN_273740 [Entamoeba invadens IP1]ELP87837.1 hypothetical protein EIN_273740 [Entamoeba invadens IP1]|eukprot:XP_004254608.1 hypothetical protein EIN_273740 [Entamoeba invadens IP1]
MALYLKPKFYEAKAKFIVYFCKLLKLNKLPQFLRAHNRFADFATTLNTFVDEEEVVKPEQKYLLPKTQDIPKVEQPPTKKAPRKSLAEMIAEQRFMMTEKGKDIKLPLLPPLRPKTPKPTEEQALAQGAKPKVQQQKQEEEKQHQKVELKPTTHQERKALIKQQRERGRYVQQATATKPTPGTPQTPHVAEQTLIRPIPQILQPPQIHGTPVVRRKVIRQRAVAPQFVIPPYRPKQQHEHQKVGDMNKQNEEKSVQHTGAASPNIPKPSSEQLIIQPESTPTQTQTLQPPTTTPLKDEKSEQQETKSKEHK